MGNFSRRSQSGRNRFRRSTSRNCKSCTTHIRVWRTTIIPESWNAFQTALSHAKTILEKEHATQDEINDAYDVLEDAYKALEKKSDTGSTGGEQTL